MTKSYPTPPVLLAEGWQPIETAPEGVMVKTKIDDEHGVRNEQSLIRRGRLWWAGDVYVYYTPTHWSPGHGQ